MAYVQPPQKGNRLPPPGMNPFRPFVIDELLRRRSEYPSPIFTPFVRMTSCLSSIAKESPTRQYSYFSLGLHGYDDASTNIFDVTYGSEREIVGYGVDSNSKKTLVDISQLQDADFDFFATKGVIRKKDVELLKQEASSQREEMKNENVAAGGTHPMPGIIDVVVNRYAMGAGIVANVTWLCYNRHQLEFLRHHFMTVGTLVVLEWGNQSTSRPINSEHILDFGNKDIVEILGKSAVYSRDYAFGETEEQLNNKSKGFIEENEGNYDYIVGSIGNFKVSFEAESNTYKVITTIYTSGEYLWGLRIDNTNIPLDESENAKKPQTIASFFQETGPFDSWLNSHKNSDMVTGDRLNFNTLEAKSTYSSTGSLNTQEIYDIQRTNPRDYNYISWDGFFDEVLSHLFNYIEMKAIQLEFRNVEAGHNQNLLSTDPDVLLIINSRNPKTQSVPTSYAKAGKFGDNTSTGRNDVGNLSSGVWLNVGMLRESFLQATTFEQAIRSVLTKINNSVAGYWDLRLHPADDGFMKIIDYKYSQPTPFKDSNNAVYKFNKNTQGECLTIDLESAFPPEVVTQLAIVAKLKSDPMKLDEILKKYPIIGQSSHYAFAMNWTNLTSTLQDKIDELRNLEKEKKSARIQYRDTSRYRLETRQLVEDSERRKQEKRKAAAGESPSTSDAPVKEKTLREKIEYKFGSHIYGFINWDKAEMIQSITRDGIDSSIESNEKANAFFAPFPTTAKIEISIVGIAGISIFDAFMVDKLPYIYDRYGIFHITEMKERITRDGWITTLVGIFRFMTFKGMSGLITYKPED